eukprot:1153895-Pelagomonas_calceolata.AAC.8
MLSALKWVPACECQVLPEQLTPNACEQSVLLITPIHLRTQRRLCSPSSPLQQNPSARSHSSLLAACVWNTDAGCCEPDQHAGQQGEAQGGDAGQGQRAGQDHQGAGAVTRKQSVCLGKT